MSAVMLTAQISDMLGVSVSTLSKALKGGS